MAMIPGISEISSRRPMCVDQADTMATGLNLTPASVHMVKEIAGLLCAEHSVRVSNVGTSPIAEVGTPTGATSIPVLDNPDDTKAKMVDLEKLIAYLTLENTKQQMEMAESRINLQKDTIKVRHEEQMKKISESLDKMDAASKSKLFSRIFGWTMTIVAVIVAAATCVVTGGIAIGAVAGAIAALTMQVLNETGAMETMTKGLTDLLKKTGMGDIAATVLANLIIMAALIAVSFACAGGASGIASLFTKSASATMRMSQSSVDLLRSISGIATSLLGSINTIAGGVTTFLNYRASMAKAETTEMAKFMAVIKQRLSESQEEFQELYEELQNGYSAIVAILSSQTDTEKIIAQEIGQMA